MRLTARPAKRELTLTTLIDLLVQIVFVFTLLLLAAGVLDGSNEGFIAPDVWRRLVKHFSVDPKHSAEEQANAMERKYAEAEEARERAQRDRDALRLKLEELDKQLAELRTKLGAPGFPPCRGPDGSELVVAQVAINASGQIRVNKMEGASSYRPFQTTEHNLGKYFERSEFTKAFQAWREEGLRHQLPCLYAATLSFNPSAPAGEYQPSRARVSSIFYVRATRAGGE